MKSLFERVVLGRLQLPNRLVIAPMTCNRAAADGTPTDMVVRYYAERASAGLIIAEAAAPSQVGHTYPNITAIHTDAHVAGWRRVTDAVHAAGGRMFLQIQHGGRVGHPEASGHQPIAPSPIPLPELIHTPSGRRESVVPREMTTVDIRATAAEFAAAARRAVDAGFAGVEVHSANGHLLHQFLSANTNKRTDAYGGSVHRRARFTAEVVDAVAAAIGADRTGLRISPGNIINGIAEGDPIALGRPFLANPDLAERLRTGAPVNQVRDKLMMYVGGETGYNDYPTLAMGNRSAWRPTN